MGNRSLGMKPTFLSVDRSGSQRWGLVIWRVVKTTSPSSAFVTEKSEGQRRVVCLSWVPMAKGWQSSDQSPGLLCQLLLFLFQ